MPDNGQGRSKANSGSKLVKVYVRSEFILDNTERDNQARFSKLVTGRRKMGIGK
jgi:hypothetical protein